MAAPKANTDAGEGMESAFSLSFGALSFLPPLTFFRRNRTKKYFLLALVKRFRGHVASLLRHPTGAAVVDELYARASQRDRDAMTAELYSKEYAVFALSGGGGSGGLTSSSSPIPSALSGALAARGGDARARREMLSRVAALLTPLLEKAMVDPPIVHRVLADFLECATEAASHEVASLLCGGGATLLRVVHTRDGARAACRALASVGAKERKAAVKAMKGHARAMAKDEWGHAVLSTALTVVDDTALLSKTVVSELAASGGEGEGDELAELCSHPHASRVFCQLLSPCDSKVLPPHTLALVKAASDRALGEDGMGAGGGGEGGTKGDENGGDDDDGDNAATTRTASEAATAAQSASKSNLTSKKSASKRRREILGSGSSPTSLGSALLSTLAANAAALLRTPAGGDLVVEAARGGGKDAILLPAHAEGVARLHEAIASAIEESSSAGGGGKKKEKKSREEREKCGKEEEECLLTHFYASRALRRLVLCGGDTASAFSSLLWKRALRGNCAQISGSHAAKVVAAIVVAGGKDIKKEAESELKGCVAGGDVAKWAAGVLKPPPAKK